MDATRILRDEHRVILRVLDCLEIALRRSEEAGTVTCHTYEPFVEFLRDFSDACHHQKEEDQLFTFLEQLGLDPTGTPVQLVADEHDHNRALTRAVAGNLDAAEAGDPAAVAIVLRSGRELVAALRRHIDKEEHCVFGMAEQAVQGAALDELLERYRQVEDDPKYREVYDRCRALAVRLAKEYGLAPVQFAAPWQLGAADRPAASPPPARPARTPGVPHGSGDMVESVESPADWRSFAASLTPDPSSELAGHIVRALGSPAVSALRGALAGAAACVESSPMLWKVLPGGFLRLFFPVTRTPDEIELGTVVAIVLLHDMPRGTTLYAHPVYAGPEANPLLKHVGGPMAHPRAQEGENGERATRRLLYHKMAIWDCFERERHMRGASEASRRWRQRYAWALLRLYFCERCPACRWGSPDFDGAGNGCFRTTGAGAMTPTALREADTPSALTRRVPAAAPCERDALQPPLDLRALPDEAEILTAIRHSEVWQIEVAYARRGGFQLQPEPWCVVPLKQPAGAWRSIVSTATSCPDPFSGPAIPPSTESSLFSALTAESDGPSGSEWTLAVFPSDAENVEGGAIVGAAVYFHRPTGTARYAQCLAAGPEPDMVLLRGDHSFGLPLPSDESGRRAYADWRRMAWSRFWLDELELGIHAASRRWLDGFWDSLRTLLSAAACVPDASDDHTQSSSGRRASRPRLDHPAGKRRMHVS